MSTSQARLDRYRRIAFNKRSIPGRHGLRPYEVEVVTGYWSPTAIGRGGKIETVGPILESNGRNPKVRFLDEEARALSGLNHGAATVGPITPDCSIGGTAFTDIIPLVGDYSSIHVRLTGPAHPNGTLFTIKELKTDHAIHWTLVIEPVEQQRLGT